MADALRSKRISHPSVPTTHTAPRPPITPSACRRPAVCLSACLPVCSSQSGVSLIVYCAAGLKKPVETAARQYESETGTRVSLQYGGTGTLLSQLQVAKRGDLYITAGEGAIEDARRLNLVRESLPLVHQRPVIAVKKGNPKGVAQLADLQQADLRIGLAHPDAASISKVSRRLLGEERWTALAASAVVMKPTVTEVAADLALGAIDAAILWDATVPQFKDLEAVEVPELSAHREAACATPLTCSAQGAEALRFARYPAAPDKGGAVFAEHGFQPAGGRSLNALNPSSPLYRGGGVHRTAIEKARLPGLASVLSRLALAGLALFLFLRCLLLFPILGRAHFEGNFDPVPLGGHRHQGADGTYRLAVFPDHPPHIVRGQLHAIDDRPVRVGSDGYGSLLRVINQLGNRVR